MNTMVTGTARRLSSGEYDAINAVMESVDRKGRGMDEKWGIGRLPTLVPAEVAAKFANQSRKFSTALAAWDYPETLKHGSAMERAYDALDALAVASGAERGPPETWEFDTPEGLVILVRDIKRTNQVDTKGRRAQVWSIDEIANVIRNHPILAAAKEAFPGAVVESIRPAQKFKHDLEDSLEGLPF